MTTPKPFQCATIDAVLEAFQNGRKFRRFLVADEVGLGKTVVAQQVVERMMALRDGPLVVIYLCSNLSIAAQNRRKLLEVLPSEERDDAICQVDRLSLLLAADDRPIHPKLHLYSLTPDTSIPMRRNRRRDGRQDERALVHALMYRTFPSFFSEWGRNVFRRTASTWWHWHIRMQDEKARRGTLQEAFRRSVREEFGVEPGQHLLPRVRELDELAIIAHLRNALAASALEELQPDLVIFDEFQRFRDLLEQEDDPASERVAGRLRGDTVDKPPALLLLSATPYRLYSRRWQDESGGSHRREFFELIEFLYGGTPSAREKRSICEHHFGTLEGELRKGCAGSSLAQEARLRIEELLRPIMARTERALHDVGWNESKTELHRAPVKAEDVRVFKHVSRSFNQDNQATAVQYWMSIPLPMQAMGNHYIAWKTAKSINPDGTPRLDQQMRDRFERPKSWPHPRLRALRELAPADRLRAPWIAPSNPWWELGRVWKKCPRKLLVFSRFQAVPPAVAAALSFDLESEFLADERIAYPDVTRRRLLAATEKRHALLALFHPSPFIIEKTEPLAERVQSIGGVRQLMKKQIKVALHKLGIRIDKDAPWLPIWKLVARLEAQAGTWERVINAWLKVHDEISRSTAEDAGLAPLLRDWNQEAERSLNSIRPSAIKMLVEYALSAPGVVIGRALRRHWREAVADEGYQHCLEAAWTGFRNYIDQRWFSSALCDPNEKYPDAIQRLIVEGNLEAVLDEHLWITSQLRSLKGPALADELRDELSVKIGLFYLHPVDNKSNEATFSIRCHAAMPFAQARVTYKHEAGNEAMQEKPLRTDDLRKAFNSPFWPHVLITTSVGQEGLDFHVWCDTVVHWDLCRNPVDLEQREGRIQRFGGLSIRKAIAQKLSADMWDQRSGRKSPWRVISKLANARLSDKSGLAPWWVCPGGEVSRYVFEIPTSEQRHWWRWVQEQRVLYRLAIGQPNQEDLIEILKAKAVDSSKVREAMINLSPWFRSSRERQME